MISEINVYDKLLTHEMCDEILNYSVNNFQVDTRTYSGWHAKTNRDLNFENKIKKILEPISPFDVFHIVWINLTEYENNRELGFHTDQRSDFTFTIPLTDGYVGGHFLIENNSYKLEKGDCISFDGFNLLHGVSAVTKGYRAALNIWIKKGIKPFL